MDGGNHETMSAAVSELLADIYLWNNTNNNENIEHEDKQNKGDRQMSSSISSCSTSSSSTTCNTHTCNNVNVDGLTKGHDNLVNRIMVLKPAFKEAERRSLRFKVKQRRAKKNKPGASLSSV